MNNQRKKRQRLENNDNCLTSTALVPQEPLALFGKPGGNYTISIINGDGGNDLNQLKRKMQSLEAKVGRLEAKKNSQAKLKTKMREMREEFTMRLETMEQKQLKQMKQIAKLKAKIKEQNRAISETQKITKEDTVKVKSEPNIQTNHQEFMEFQPNVLQSRHPQLQLLIKSKRSIGNPQGNSWSWNALKKQAIIILPDGLNANINFYKNSNPTGWWNIYAMKGFPTFALGVGHSPHNTIIYYYEVKCTKPAKAKSSKMKFRIGLSDSYRDEKFLVGNESNTFALSHACANKLFISGQITQFKLPTPEGAIKSIPLKRTGSGDVYGFGLVLSPDNTLAIFVTLNGALMCNQIPISCSVDCLYPSVSMSSVSIEANFGGDPAKPFLYDIQKCPGMVFK